MKSESTVLRIDIRGGVDEARLSAALAKVVEAHDLAGVHIENRLVQIDSSQHRWEIAFPARAVDHESLTVLYHALANAYANNGGAEERVSYSQYIEWRRELEQDHSAPAGRAFWEGSLGIGLPDPLSAPRLPFRATRLATPEDETRARAVQAIDADTTSGIERAAMTSQAPVEVVLHAAWHALLARICGQTTFVTGWQHDCRFDYAHFANTVGPFETVLPLAESVWPDERFSALLERHAQTLDTAKQWQEWWPLDVAHNSPHHAVGFAIAHRPAPVGGWSIEDWPEPARSLELVLQIELDSAGKPAQVSIHYARNCYDDASIRALLRQYLTLLRALPSHLASPIARLPVVSDDERREVLAINALKKDIGSIALPEIIAQWARKTPAAPALVSNDETLTYAELANRVDAWAHWLSQQGVGRETPVALCMARSTHLIVALLAVMRSGGAYLPLDPSWPIERRQRILSIAQCNLVLDDAAFAAEPPSLFVATSSPLPAIQLDQGAYLLFTSGSTGEPKGVVVEHRQLLNYVAAASEALDLPSCRRAALTSTVAADLGNTTLFGALFNGAALVVASEADMQDGASFARFIDRHAVDCLKIVPSHLAALIDTEVAIIPRTVIFGGEPTSHGLVERARELNPSCRIYNHYGPTETTVGVLTHSVAVDSQEPTLPLTRALANTQVYLLDDSQRIVPIGAIGELYIGGSQVCRGYLGKPNVPEFVLYSGITDERLYRTGDLGRYLPDGGLLLMGRADDQVKIRGFRVELGEIEAALLAQPPVRQAAVQLLAGSHDRADSSLAAFISLHQSARELRAEQVAAELRNTLDGMLPKQMVPAFIHVLPELPRLPNGKIDRRGLAELRNSPTREYVAPRNALESVLADFMAKLLGIERMSATESFLAAGGNSLLVIKLVARIRQQFDVEIPPGIVFDMPTPAALTGALLEHEIAADRLQQQAELLVAH